MKTVYVSIEEHLCKTVPIQVPDNLDVNERMKLAENIALQNYRSGKIVLDSTDYNGITLYSVEDKETKESTEWYQIY